MSFSHFGSISRQQASGVGLQDYHSVCLSPPLLPGQVPSGLGLQFDDGLAFFLILMLQLARTNQRLQSVEAELDL